ncbi:MAG: MATE family efflux transporter [Gammaproteobacteria bacterium]|nr:MATE family efflux transporter [Gammaproteobacteria bacterium]NIR84509.1 MATE family efflux transporter [Gammaproteobacteria bacterium]NIR90412.1 MATE family efflux transporter [Gammaproteobacteria bacterium]NIU05560.1 MATE family efflux transporter [Gammaproteobacteria bacterium]NIV52699.1 MATE family efflux transporter [Gammaproteobacteria bacterium]
MNRQGSHRAEGAAHEAQGPLWHAAPPAPLTLSEHAGATLRLAFPVMVARAGLLVLVAVDTAMTGHVSGVELAYYSLATAPQVPMLLVGIGLMMGTAVLAAQADGAGHATECGAIWRVALAHAAVVGAVLLLLCQLGEEFLALTGQSADNARGGGRVLAMFGWGAPALLLYVATTFFLEGIHRPLPGVVVMVFANLINVGLNWVFIYGHWGAPAMGAEGAALATSMVRWFMFAAISGYVLVRIAPQGYGVRAPIRDAGNIGRSLRRIGYPMGLSHGLESAAFSAMILFAGLLGATQAAAYMIAMNVVSLVFMCSIGFAAAASVRVANAVGRGAHTDVRRAGWVAAALAAVMLLFIGVLVRGVPDAIAVAFTDDPEVLPLAVATVRVAALVLLPDGLQAILMGAVRGTGHVWPATLRYLLAFWLVMTPLGYVLGVRWEGGAPALMTSVMVGCIAATLLLGARFRAVTRA